jgi:hypothetical protein
MFIGEVNMFRTQAPILIVPTAEAREALGVHLRPAALAAHREIALAAKGLEIAYLQFSFGRLTLAVCSRVRRDGLVEIEIEIGLGDPRLPKSTFTAAQMRQAEAAAHARGHVHGQARGR